jgi:hypothetical protein
LSADVLFLAVFILTLLVLGLGAAIGAGLDGTAPADPTLVPYPGPAGFSCDRCGSKAQSDARACRGCRKQAGPHLHAWCANCGSIWIYGMAEGYSSSPGSDDAGGIEPYPGPTGFSCDACGSKQQGAVRACSGCRRRPGEHLHAWCANCGFLWIYGPPSSSQPR